MGDVARPTQIDSLAALPRVDLAADFHCVTTWSVRGLEWSGVSFSDFHERAAMPMAAPADDARFVVLHGSDGYRSMLPLDDLLAADILLADRLNGEVLSIEHGAPLRLVAPAHYGYKNVKHLVAIEYLRDRRGYRFPWPYPAFMDHPRARVAYEERGHRVPAWLLKPIYRLLVPFTIKAFRKAMRRA